MNRYPFWRYALIGLALIFSLIYTLPNFYGESPAVQISSQKATIKVDAATESQALAALDKAGIPNTGVLRDDNSVKIRFESTDTQLRARDVLEKAMNPDPADPVYITALNLLSASPTWLTQLHALPMYLGLDLRGGVHFLMQIDTTEALNKRLDSAMADVRTLLRDRKVRHNGIKRNGKQLVLDFASEDARTRAQELLRDNQADLAVQERGNGDHSQLLLISGARWTHENTAPLQALFPQAHIITFYGASETSYVSWMQATSDAPPQAVGRPFGNVQVHIGAAETLPQASGSGNGPHETGDHADPTTRPQPGLIWVRSPMLFIDYVNGQDATAARRVGEWLTVRDIGWQDAQGNLYLVGRENRMIVTQARNLFPEEVEARLMAHPGISQAAVLGLPDPQRGQVVHAVLMRPSDDGSHAPSMTGSAEVEAPALVPLTPAPADLVAWCHQALESYKVPRHWWRWQGKWPMTASGKTDLTAIRQALEGATRIRP